MELIDAVMAGCILSVPWQRYYAFDFVRWRHSALVMLAMASNALSRSVILRTVQDRTTVLLESAFALYGFLRCWR